MVFSGGTERGQSLPKYKGGLNKIYSQVPASEGKGEGRV